MEIIVISLFPEVFVYFDYSILNRAREKGLLDVRFINPRDFTSDKHRTVDDYPYGGGAGMVIKPEPVFSAVEKAREMLGGRGKVIITTPQGRRLNQSLSCQLSKENALIILCGHYEGFDERIYSLADMEISIGDYVLTGGELPAMVIIDSLARMIPGVIEQDSAALDSFQNSLLDYPHYTRPPVFRDMEVPEILLSGNHGRIQQWRRKESIRRTMINRPDLLEDMEINPEDMGIIDEIIKEEYEK